MPKGEGNGKNLSHRSKANVVNYCLALCDQPSGFCPESPKSIWKLLGPHQPGDVALPLPDSECGVVGPRAGQDLTETLGRRQKWNNFPSVWLEVRVRLGLPEPLWGQGEVLWACQSHCHSCLIEAD